MEAEQISLVVAAIALIGTFVGIAISNSQARSARGQLQVSQKAQRESSEPYVIVDIGPRQPGDLLLTLTIQNTGPTMARNVRITASPELESSAGDDITEALQATLRQTIPTLPPGRRLEFYFDGHGRFQSDLPMKYEFTVNADGPEGPVEELTYTVDLDVLAWALVGERPTKKLEEKLGKIEAVLKSLTQSYDTANAQAIEEAKRARMQEVRQRIARREQGMAAADDASAE
jgi:hypothetical protein